MNIDEISINRCLRHALKHFQGGEKRWAKRAKQGLSDKELRKAIQEEFYLGGGFFHPNLPPCCYRGGDDPALFLGSLIPLTAKKTIKGKELILRVRNLFRIKYPNAGYQKRFF